MNRRFDDLESKLRQRLSETNQIDRDRDWGRMPCGTRPVDQQLVTYLDRHFGEQNEDLRQMMAAQAAEIRQEMAAQSADLRTKMANYEAHQRLRVELGRQFEEVKPMFRLPGSLLRGPPPRRPI